MLKRVLMEPGALALLLAIQIWSLRQLEKRRILDRDRSRFLAWLTGAMMFAAIVLNPVLGIVPAHQTWPMLRAVLLIACLLAPLTAFALALAQQTHTPQQPARRAARRATIAALCAAPWALAGYGIVVGRRNFQVNEQKIRIPGLPAALDGLRIAQLTDIHYGPFLSANDLRYVVGMANELQPHLTLVTGDLITNRSELLKECLDLMHPLRSTLGVYGCHGNHESYAKCESDADRLAAAMGWSFLRGQTRRLSWNGADFFLSGIDFPWVPEEYLQELAQLPKPGETHLLLSHNPDTFPMAAKLGYALQLSGHTHGGQVNLDLARQHLNPVSLITPYTRGIYNISGRQCFVSSGIGTIGVPIRIGAPPEVALIQLCAS